MSRARKNGRDNGHQVRRGPERAVIAAVRLPRQRRWEVEESLEELAGLAVAAGATVVQRVSLEREAPTPGLYFGRGKIEEGAGAAPEAGRNLFISDDPRRDPGAQPLADDRHEGHRRTALILDHLAQRARTAEGKLQVELAQLTYLLPRLVGQGTHLERWAAASAPGVRASPARVRPACHHGAGSCRSSARWSTCRRTAVAAHGRASGHADRRLVGYTNAGKTRCFNRLSGARLTPPTSSSSARPGRAWSCRGCARSSYRHVGFIRKLPHQLVAAFRATLEELKDADVLVHVMDASHPASRKHAAPSRALGEMEVADRPMVLALNKIDRTEGGRGLEAVVARRGRVAISATTGEGLQELLKAIDAALRSAPP